MANLLPVGNQLVTLSPLSATVRLEQLSTHVGLTLVWWDVGREAVTLEKISGKLFQRLRLIFKQ